VIGRIRGIYEQAGGGEIAGAIRPFTTGMNPSEVSIPRRRAGAVYRRIRLDEAREPSSFCAYVTCLKQEIAGEGALH
jgi:hypothetical protein